VSNLAHTVERSILLDAPPEQVWEALTDSAFLNEWLAAEVEVEVVEEAERLAFSWWRDGAGPSRVELIVDAVAAGTRLTVVESGLLPMAAPMLAASWGQSLRRLSLAVGRCLV
jgi:uncharacterized protein YndB with AHSA1/START domain